MRGSGAAVDAAAGAVLVALGVRPPAGLEPAIGDVLALLAGPGAASA